MPPARLKVRRLERGHVCTCTGTCSAPAPAQLPRGRDVNCYILKVVLHDWITDKAVAILRNIGTAMAEAGVPTAKRRLFVAEQVLSTGDPLTLPKVGLDMNMMVMCGGLERTAPEWDALLDQAGWATVTSFPTPSLFTVMQAVPK